MAKQKQKKIKKEMEKLQRAGRYWEWLIIAQEQPPSPELKREIEQTWKEIPRRALRAAEQFEEFCLYVDKVKGVPTTPDMELLKALKAITHGAPTNDDVFQIKGLSSAFQTVAQNLQSSLQARDLNQPKMESLLRLMAPEPSKITRRHYSELADLLSGTTLEEPIQILAEEIPLFRKLNHKITLKKSIGNQLMEDLSDSDIEIANAADAFPDSLKRLLLLPFCAQVILHLQNCAVRPNVKSLTDIFNTLEFLFPFIAGDRKQELDRALFPEDVESLSEADLLKMEKDFASAAFEEKLCLLRDLRHDFHDTLGSGESRGPFSFFDDTPDTEKIEALLIKFYQQVLDEIARLAPTLNARDRRTLPDIMDPLLTEDAGVCFPGDTNPQALTELLLHAAEAGCMGKRLAMLGILASRWDRSRKLLPLAVQALQDAHLPQAADMEWLFKEWGPLMLKSIKNLGVIFERVRDNDKALGELAYSVWSFVNTSFFMNSTLPSFGGLPLPLGENDIPSAIDASQVRELEQIADQEEKLQILRNYLAIFPQRRVSPENLSKWLELTWADKALHEYFFETLEMAFSGTSFFLKALSLMADLEGAPSNLFKGENLTGAVLDFFKAHVADFRTMPVETVERVMEILLPVLEDTRGGESLLVRLYNVFTARAEAGEREFSRISNDLKARMKPAPKAARRPPKIPKRR